MSSTSEYFAGRINSFRFAFHGIGSFFRHEPNAWLHLLATVIVVAMAIWFPTTSSERIALIFAIGIVWVAEMFNTCIERTVDLISLEKHKSIGFIKDLSAAAVLVAAIIALATGLIIFIPKF